MLVDFLNIPKSNRKPFKKHFIKNVFVEFIFESLSTKEILDNHNKLTNSFEKLNFVKNKIIKQVELKITKQKKETTEKEAGIVFFNDQEKIKIDLIENKLILSTHMYVSFDILLSKIKIILDIINSTFNNEIFLVSLVLKKRNALILKETKSFADITSIFHPPLLSSIRTDIVPFKNFDFCQDEIRTKSDRFKCTIVSNCKRNTYDEFEVNLDIAIFNLTKINILNVAVNLNEMNDFNFNIFNHLITDYFKNIMNGEK